MRPVGNKFLLQLRSKMSVTNFSGSRHAIADAQRQPSRAGGLAGAERQGGNFPAGRFLAARIGTTSGWLTKASDLAVLHTPQGDELARQHPSADPKRLGVKAPDLPAPPNIRRRGRSIPKKRRVEDPLTW